MSTSFDVQMFIDFHIDVHWCSLFIYPYNFSKTNGRLLESGQRAALAALCSADKIGRSVGKIPTGFKHASWALKVQACLKAVKKHLCKGVKLIQTLNSIQKTKTNGNNARWRSLPFFFLQNARCTTDITADQSFHAISAVIWRSTGRACTSYNPCSWWGGFKIDARAENSQIFVVVTRDSWLVTCRQEPIWRGHVAK